MDDNPNCLSLRGEKETAFNSKNFEANQNDDNAKISDLALTYC